MAFVPAANGWFGARMPGGAGAGQGRNTNLPPGKVPHPSDIRTGSQGPLGRVRANGHSPCHPEDRAFFPDAHFHAGLPPPQRQSAQGRTRSRGPHGVLATVSPQGQRARGVRTQAQGRILSWGVRYGSPWWLKV